MGVITNDMCYIPADCKVENIPPVYAPYIILCPTEANEPATTPPAPNPTLAIKQKWYLP